MGSLNRALLVVCPEGPVLRLFRCVSRLTGWSVDREELLDMPSPELNPEAIAAAVRPIALRWSISAGAEVALILPAVTGGILTVDSGTGSTGPDRARLERDMAGSNPYPLGDVEYEVRPGDANSGHPDQVAWIPRTVALEFRNAFARLGLVLGEIVFRAQLFALGRSGHVAKGVRLVVENWADDCSFHVLADDRVLGTSCATLRSAREFVDRLQLELLTLEASGRPATRVVLAAPKGEFDGTLVAAIKDHLGQVVVERQPTDISELFVRFWSGGATGICLNKEASAALGAMRRIAFAIAAIGVLLSGALAWHAGNLREEISALEVRETRLRPPYQALVAKERQAVSLAKTADAVGRMTAAPAGPQAALLAVFNALPKSAYVTRFTIEDGRATVVGKGLDTDSVVTKLKDQPGVGRVENASNASAESEPSDAAARFRVQFRLEAGATEGTAGPGKGPR